MIPVNQTKFGAPGGNCFSACIASILDLPIEKVPYFMSSDMRGREWVDKLTTWLAPSGLYPLNFVFLRGDPDITIQGIHILHGKSPRGVGTHAVVAKGNTVVWDPHPSRAGIRNITEKTVLVPFEPQVVRCSYEERFGSLR